MLLRTLRREAHALSTDPAITRVHLHNMLAVDEGDRAADLLQRASVALGGSTWLRLRNRPDPGPGRSALVSSLRHARPVSSLGWAHDGELTFGDADGALHRWNPVTGSLDRLGPEVAPDGSSLAWSPDGRFLGFTDAEGSVRVWDMDRGAARATAEPGVRAGTLAWSPDGAALAAVGGETVRLWSPAVGWEPTTIHEDGVDSLAWSPDGARLATLGRRVKVWDRATATCEATLEVEPSLFHRALRWAPDGEIVVAWDGHTWASSSPSERIDLPRFVGTLDDVAWSGDGALLAYATGRWGDDHGPGDVVLRIWNRAGRSVVAVLPWAERLAWAPDRPLLATAWGGSIHVWDASRVSAAVPEGAHSDIVSRVAWAPDGSSLASTGRDPRELRVWDGSTGVLQWSRDEWDRLPPDDPLEWSPRSGPGLGTWSPDGRLVATGRYRTTLVIRDEDAGEELGTWTLPASIGGLAWSPDGSLLAVGSFGGGSAVTEHHVRLWSRDARNLVADLAGHRGSVERLAWSPNGDRLASGDREGAVWVWSVGRGRGGGPRTRGRAITGSPPSGRMIWRMSWSPDGRVLAVADESGVVGLWDAEVEAWGPALWAACGIHGALGWSHSGTWLATGGGDGSVRVWDRAGGDVAEARCLSSVEALQWAADDVSLLVADDGASSGNRPLPYVFELVNPDRGGMSRGA
jgi:WD40 repeat protein